MIADDASNVSMVAAFVAAALIGGIAMTLHALWQLRRYDRDGASDTGMAGTVLTGPWTGTEPTGQSWEARS